MNRTRLLHSLLALAAVLGVTAPVAAQYSPNPYNPYGPAVNYNYGPGATLSGGAQVINATGEMYIQQEQARQQRQKYYQDKVTTKKMAFDEANYEKANTPTVTEDQARVLNLQVQRILNQANPAEIKRGDTLNTLLPYLKAMSDQGAAGPPVPINPTLLRSINVKVGTAGAAPGAGLLKDAGRLSWPLMLRGPRQKTLDKLLPEACSAAANGTLEQPQYTKIVGEVQSMQDELRQQYRKEKITGSSFLSGQAYLDSLLSSLKVLERPDAALFFNGGYTARGNNVPELVDNMMAQGLSFAPATPGFDAAYFALHNAFVSYARAARAGMQLGMAAPSTGKGPRELASINAFEGPPIMLTSLAPALAIALLGGAPAGPEIVNPHPTYGYLGAPRPKTGILPGDTAHFSFGIKNLKADKTGKVAYSIAIIITDAAGKVIFEQKPYKAVAQHFFGGDLIPAAARIEVPIDSKPGPVYWKVSVTDRTTKATTELKGEGKVLPADFGLVQVGTFADAEDRVPTPPVGVVGGQLYVSFGAIGFGRGGKDMQPDLQVSLRIVDDKGQPTIAQPLTGRVNQEIGPEVRIVPLQFPLTLDRAGRYTVELTAQDRLSGKSASVSFPVRILPAD